MTQRPTSWPVEGGSLDGTTADVLGNPQATTLWEPLEDGTVEVYRWSDGAAGKYVYDHTEEA